VSVGRGKGKVVRFAEEVEQDEGMEADLKDGGGGNDGGDDDGDSDTAWLSNDWYPDSWLAM
jgi:hypothetical protein